MTNETTNKLTTEESKVSLSIEVKGALLRDLKRIATGLEMDLDKAALTILKKGVKKEIRTLDKEQDEVFLNMLHANIHPDYHHNFKTIDDIIAHMAGD